MPQGGGNKAGSARAARLEAELRANLRKRKDQARARARPIEPAAAPADAKPHEEGNG